METVKRLTVPGIEKGGRKERIGAAQENFRAVKLFNMTLSWWTHGIH